MFYNANLYYKIFIFALKVLLKNNNYEINLISNKILILIYLALILSTRRKTSQILIARLPTRVFRCTSSFFFQRKRVCFQPFMRRHFFVSHRIKNSIRKMDQVQRLRMAQSHRGQGPEGILVELNSVETKMLI
jgi:hypothetical protein